MVSFAAETVRLSLADAADLHSPVPGTLEVKRRGRTIRLKRLDLGVEAALRRLTEGKAGAAELEKVAMTADSAADLDRLAQEIGRLAGRSLIVFSCVVAGEELMRATAIAPLADFDFAAPAPSAAMRLSRFAYARRDGERIVLESPASHARVEILLPALGSLLFQAARPITIPRLCDAMPDCASVIHAAVGFLLGVGVLTAVDPSGQSGEETRPSLAMREFHDVLLHASSRIGLGDKPLGATFRFQRTVPPLPAIKELPDGPRIVLPRPDLERVAAQDPPLTEVMESRRSIRDYSAEPITVDQLGEFLYRVARVKSILQVDEAIGRPYEASRRTYPSGGASYDLEFYLTVLACRGLDTGMYHYDPAGHRLTLVCARADPVRRLAINAQFASGRQVPPEVLITLASRFGRLGWKYEGIAYATTLKNVGVLYEAMYLVATAMELAPCALGSGDSAAFSDATGLDPLIESSVGEFMLGARGER